MKLAYRPRSYDFIGRPASGLGLPGKPRLVEVGELLEYGDYTIHYLPNPNLGGVESRIRKEVPIRRDMAGTRVTDYGEGLAAIDHWGKK